MRPVIHSLAILIFGVTVCLALTLPTPLLAQATTPIIEKEQLLARHLIDGTVAIGQKNYEAALKEFLAAREADPTDFDTNFFLGMTHLRLKQYEKAIQALRKAHELNPDAIEVYFPIGEAYYLAKDYQAALPFLEKAREEVPDNALAHYFLGATYFRMGKYEIAQPPLQRAGELDPTLRQSTEFMRGTTALRAGQLGEAKELYLEAQRIDPKSDIAGFSEQFVKGIDVQERARKRFAFHLSTAFGYDTNVQQIFSETVTNTGTAVSTYEAGVQFRPIIKPRFNMGMGYTFLEQIPHELNELDVQGHVGYLFANMRIGPLWLAPQYSYGYYFENTQDFFQASTVRPAVNLPWRNSLTSLYYEYQDRRFRTNRLRKGSINALGVKELLSFWNNQVRLEAGYRVEEEAAMGDDFDRTLHTISGQLTLPMPLRTQLRVKGHWRFKDYFRTHSIFDVERDEEEQLIAGYLSRKFGDYITVTAGWQYLNNNSNVELFDFNKNYYVMEMAVDF
ncbi:tetratricopeptide repeat protein [Nitrospinae bacterium AH_259_B05_G02_I21]|nr:tetratricopeptide repeat protein [Nitrospinae bacterium AH_259_B05_G02_I21]